MSLINREALYEKACGLEAQALSYVGKIANDETKIEEWRIWSAILTERTAFKHDIFDAPEVKPERTGKWNCSDDMYESAVCSACGWDTTEPWDHIRHWFKFCPNCGARMESET